jgi:hypothetical protein
MSTTLEPAGEEEHEGASCDFVDDKDEGEDASATLEILFDVGKDPNCESAEQGSKTPEFAAPSPSPRRLLPEPAATTREPMGSPLHGTAPPGQPASQALLSMDLLQRPASATLPLTPRSSSRIPLLPGPSPVTLASVEIGPDVALPSPAPTVPPPARSEATTFTPGDSLLAPTLEPPATPLPTLESTPTTSEPPFGPAASPSPATLTDSQAWMSAPAAIAAALGAIVAAHVSPSSPSAPAARTSPPTTARPVLVSAPIRRRPVQRPTGPVQRRTAAHPRRSQVGTSIKIALLAIELPLTLMLATYAGVIPLLPPTPPAARVTVAGDGTVVQARQSLYCWFTPGQARCSAPSSPSAQTLPALSVHRDGVLQFSFSYPAPTTCVASTPDNASILGATKPLGTLLVQNGGMGLAPRTYGLRVTLAPGTYSVVVFCRWNPPQTLRWLQGQGESTYWVAVHVLPG